MKIGFLTQNAYPILMGQDEGAIGGAEVQQTLVGKELAARGHDVVFIEDNQPDKRAGVIDGVKVALKEKTNRDNAALRAGQWSLATVQALAREDPDVCYHRVMDFDVIPTALYCRATGTRFVYGFAHDSEVTDDPIVFDTARTNNSLYRRLMHWSVNQADLLVAQNSFQQTHARRRFTSETTLIPNGYPAEAEVTPVEFPTKRPVVLWVARLTPWKQPKVVLKLARAFPQALFVLVGPGEDDDLEARVLDASETLENIRYEGYVPFTDIDRYFSAADIFLNTSSEEGFPNTFLQSWATGTPVVSLTVDPDGVLDTKGVGLVADGSRERLRELLAELIGDSEKRRQLGDEAAEYFREHHSIERIADAYERAFSA